MLRKGQAVCTVPQIFVLAFANDVKTWKGLFLLFMIASLERWARAHLWARQYSQTV